MRQKFTAAQLLSSRCICASQELNKWWKSAALQLIASSIRLSAALTSRHAASSSSSDLPSLHIRQLIAQRCTSPTMLSCIYVPGPPHRATPSNTHTQVRRPLPHPSCCQSGSGRARLLPPSQGASPLFVLFGAFCRFGG